MGKKPDKDGKYSITTAADLDAALNAEAELIPLEGMQETGVGVETPPEVQRLVEEPPEPPAETTKVEVPNKSTTTVIFSTGKSAGEKGNTKHVHRDGLRPRYYPGDVPLEKAMYELFFENLGTLHDKIGDSMRDVLGDVFTGLVFVENGETFLDTEFRTPPYRVVDKDRSLGVEPVSPNGIETIGEVVKIHPGTKKPLTQDEQRGLKRLRIEMDAYGKGGMPEFPEREYEPIEQTEHEDLREYHAVQGIGLAIVRTAEREFGENIEKKMGYSVVCKLVEIEYRGRCYRVRDLKTPVFKLVKETHHEVDEKTQQITTEEYVWAKPVDPKYEGLCFGQLVKNPETGESITVNEYGSLKVKVELDRCYNDNPTPPTTKIDSRTKRARFE